MNTTYGVLNNSSLIIDTDKLRENVRTILRSLPAGTKLIPVVKDDAYGMGMVGVARTLSAFPEIGCFAVANVSEGVTLRREGIRQDILIMGSTLPFQYAPAVECDLTVTVSRLGMVFVGLIFIVIGNYLPKCRHNYTVGIRLPWTLDDEDNWNHTHRFAGYVWIIAGVVTLLSVFLSHAAVVWVAAIFVASLSPLVYSFVYAKRHGKI